MTRYPLAVEANTRALATADLRLGKTLVMVTPPIDENFWLLRVRVGKTQALVLFPKFGMYGIGFQHETDWNTNLPSACTANEIYTHIRHNKGDKSIPRERCVKAIRALQAEIVRLTGNKSYAPVVVNGVEMHFRDAEDQGLVTP